MNILATVVAFFAATSGTVGERQVPLDHGPRVAEFKQALEQRRLNEAWIMYSALVAARLPEKASGKPDPLLDQLTAELMSYNGNWDLAVPVLDRLVITALGQEKARAQFLKGLAEESRGDFKTAVAQYQAVLSNPNTSAADQLRAQFGLARVQTLDSPALALTTLGAIDLATIPKQNRWEYLLLKARAAEMAGDKALAKAALDDAWLQAISAHSTDAAVARILKDIAFRAAREGDEQASIAALTVDRFSGQADLDQESLAKTLPPCGVNGLKPEDQVVIEVSAFHRAARPIATVLWASRPGIGGEFMRAAARSPSLNAGSGAVTAFQLRCSTSASADVVPKASIDAARFGWMTALGAYPAGPSNENGSFLDFASMVAQREARYGPDSVMALPLFIGALQPVNPEVASQSGYLSYQLEIVNKARSILKKENAPEYMQYQVEILHSTLEKATRSSDAVAYGDEWWTFVDKTIANKRMTPELIFEFVATILEAPTASENVKKQSLAQAVSILRQRKGTSQELIRNLLERQMNLHWRSGNRAAATVIASELGISPASCKFADKFVSIVRDGTTEKTFPPTPRAAGIEGYTITQFAVDPAGKPVNPRVIFSVPPSVFDETTLKSVRGVQLNPAYKDGKPISCESVSLPFRWNLRDQE
jgi:TonB family protein